LIISKDKKEIFDCVVIGGGAAGIAAAIQLKRAGISVLVVEKSKLGGSLWNANLIENYPGFPEGIRGSELAQLFVRQFEKTNILTLFSNVTKINRTNDIFELNLEKNSENNNSINNKVFSRAVIIAIGLEPRKIKLKEEQKLQEAGLLFYEIKEIPQKINNKNFVIIGSGDVAFDYALNLAERGNKCSIISRNNQKCIDTLKQRACNNKNINILGAEVEKIQLCDGVLSISCNHCKEVKADYVLIAIGKETETKQFSELIQEKNNEQGIFIAGDAKRAQFRQVGIAVGDGLLAAMRVKEFLGDKK
jgi:thioredoxin reductase (NADPH)